jgi:hypothetical protein
MFAVCLKLKQGVRQFVGGTNGTVARGCNAGETFFCSLQPSYQDSATLERICRKTPTRRSYRRQTVDGPRFPRSGERSYIKVALSS